MQAIRALAPEERPQQLLGCEVWRNLDWLMDDAKVLLDVSAHENLAAALNGVFDSQISGGKRYDLAVLGRRHTNATFLASHDTDRVEQLCFAMDLTPLIRNDGVDLVDYVSELIQRFETDVKHRLKLQLGRES